MLFGVVITRNVDNEVVCSKFILYLTAHLIAQILHIFITIFFSCKQDWGMLSPLPSSILVLRYKMLNIRSMPTWTVQYQ